MTADGSYRSSDKGFKRALALAPLALAVGLVSQQAMAANRTWSGAGGSSFWDLATNWLTGLPVAGDSAALGTAGTTIRSLTWNVSSVSGSGTLTVSGGTLNAASASSIGSLVLAGGVVGGSGELTLGALSWTSGSFGYPLSPGGTTTVNGPASLIANGHSVNYGRTLNLNGDTTLAGNGQLYIDGAGLYNGTTAYTKSIVNLAAGKTLTIDGTVAPSLQIYGGGTFNNAGTVTKAGGSSTLFIDADFNNSAGTVNVGAGEVQFRGTRSVSGSINVASGATLHLNGAITLDPLLALSNNGTVAFDGTYNLLSTGTLSLGAAALGSGSLGGAGALVFSSFRWDGGSLGTSASLGGSTTVNGPSIWSASSHSVSFGHTLNLNGDTTWGDNGLLFIEGASGFNGTPYGASSVNLAVGKTLSLAGTASNSFQIYGSGNFNNAGTVVKAAGNSFLYLDGNFNNSGILRADAGTVLVRGTINNTGEMVANGARVEVQSTTGLQQWDASTQTLTGGTYRVTGAQPIALNLGTVVATGSPASVVNNNAKIFLNGAGAAVVTTTLAPETNALAALTSNTGVLSVTGGAQLKLATTTSLDNKSAGSVVLGASSALTGGAAFGQSGGASSTFIGGTLGAAAVSFSAGSLSAGEAAGLIGSGVINAASVGFASGLRFDEDLAAGVWDRLQVQGGNLTLGGTLNAVFAASAVPGTYRFLTTDSGLVSGTFSGVLSNLNPANYSVTAIYGANYVDLSVTVVSEPQSYALLLAGVLLIGLYTRRSVSERGY